jgi:DNA polymerase (family 10)
MDKYEVAQILREMAVLIEIIDENPRKAISYKRAAQTVESLHDLTNSVREKTLTNLPGIGPELAKTITILVEKGHFPYFEKLKERIPQSLVEIALIPGMTVRKLRTLYEKLQITNLSALEKAFIEDSLGDLKGFGPSYRNKILRQIAIYRSDDFSLLYPKALQIAQAFVERLNTLAHAIDITGSIRRKLELINQIDLIALTDAPKRCISTFTTHLLIKEVLFQNENEARVILKHGIKARLQLSDSSQYPFLLLHSTGNTQHLSALQQEAQKNECTLTETSLQATTSRKKKQSLITSENDIYAALGLPFIYPELREGYGEIEAAKKGHHFNLIEESDLRGTFHCHTIDSDGKNTLQEMTEAAQKLGWEYIGISDHSKSSYQANGMTEERLLTQVDAIRKSNQKLKNFQVFSGIECDILKDGSLDFSDEILKQLDFVIISAHRYFKMDKDDMTQRFIRAIENPYTTIIGHLTGRILRYRDPYQLDIPKIIDACISNEKIMELNAYPNRLDMDWRYWIKAKEKGLKCCINPDAHSTKGLENCKFGINMARKGWLDKYDVINTLSLKEMKSFLKK